MKKRKKRMGKSGGLPKTRGQRFVEGVLSGHTQMAAALDAGFSMSAARSTREKLWSQKNIQAEFRKIVQRVLPPSRAEKMLNDLLQGKSAEKKLQRERVFDGKGRGRLQIVSATETESFDGSLALRTLAFAAEHSGMIPRTRTAPPISSDSLESVLERARVEHIKNGDLMTPTWLLERAKRLANAHALPAAPEPEPEHVTDNFCDSCNSQKCPHDRCPSCELCEICDADFDQHPEHATTTA